MPIKNHITHNEVLGAKPVQSANTEFTHPTLVVGTNLGDLAYLALRSQGIYI